MPAAKIAKVECLNPNTGGRMNIDKEIYDLFSKAISYGENREGYYIHPVVRIRSPYLN